MWRLSRFYTGKTLKHSALFHFGSQPVTEQLPGWFEQYNGRQTIEAGIGVPTFLPPKIPAKL